MFGRSNRGVGTLLSITDCYNLFINHVSVMILPVSVMILCYARAHFYHVLTYLFLVVLVVLLMI